MSEAFDIYTLLFLVLAVVIFIRLRNVLGRRTGNERPPFDPYSAPDQKRPGAPKTNEPVVALPRGRSGTVERLRRIGEDMGFEVEAVPLLELEGERVSSTRIRAALSEGAG